MRPDEMEALFRVHRGAEARRDYDTVIDTFAEDCYLRPCPLNCEARARRGPGRLRRVLHGLPGPCPRTRVWPSGRCHGRLGAPEGIERR